MSQQSLFIADGTESGNVASVTATNRPDGGYSLQTLIAQYNSTPPTITDGYMSFLQVDSNGLLKTSASVSITYASNPNTALPTQAAWVGASDGTNLQGLLVESSSNHNLRSSLFYGATEMIIANDGYTAVHQADSPWIISGTVTANAGTGTFDVNVTNATLAVTQSGTWTVQQGTPPWSFAGTYAPNVAAGSDAVKSLIAQYEATLTAVTDTNVGYARSDGYGRLEVAGARAVAYKHETAASQTVTLKSGAGVMRKVIVGSAGVTGATITFYDNTAGSGTIISVVNTSNILGQLEFDVSFATGLTYVTNNKVPGDITITYE